MVNMILQRTYVFGQVELPTWSTSHESWVVRLLAPTDFASMIVVQTMVAVEGISPSTPYLRAQAQRSQHSCVHHINSREPSVRVARLAGIVVTGFSPTRVFRHFRPLSY